MNCCSARVTTALMGTRCGLETYPWKACHKLKKDIEWAMEGARWASVKAPDAQHRRSPVSSNMTVGIEMALLPNVLFVWDAMHNSHTRNMQWQIYIYIYTVMKSSSGEQNRKLQLLQYNQAPIATCCVSHVTCMISVPFCTFAFKWGASATACPILQSKSNVLSVVAILVQRY